MRRLGIRTTFFLLVATLLTGPAFATTREVADLQPLPLTSRQSVLGELSGDLLWDGYDELQRRPYNLPLANIDRLGYLTPWPGQGGEQTRYFNGLIGNNGNANVRNGSDTLQGSYMRRPGDALSWGLSAAYVSDDVGNENTIGTSSFGDNVELSGFDLRVAGGYLLSERTSIGAGIGVFDRKDEVTDRTFEQGVGGFYGVQDLEQSGVELDAGIRRFVGERASWEAQLIFGIGGTDFDDSSETLDGNGLVTSMFVGTRYEISDSYLEFSGAYSRRQLEEEGELRFRLGYALSEHELDNSNLAFTESAGVVTPSLTLQGQDAVSEDTLFASVGSVRRYGTTQLFSGARLSSASRDGSTRVDSLGTPVVEAIDDTLLRLDATIGLRQPLWNERFRLIAAAHADWSDDELETVTDNNSSATRGTHTTSRFSVGVEGVFGNITFDVAWLFGDATASGFGSRQVIDIDRLVISATLAR